MASRTRRRAARATLPKSDINITPLIDVLLVLVVIFMVITPQTPTGLDAAVPQPSKDIKGAAPEKAIVLSIDRDGATTINQDRVEPSMLAARLKDIMQSRSDRTVFIQGSSELDFNAVVQVIDVAKGVGVDRIGLLTRDISLN